MSGALRSLLAALAAWAFVLSVTACGHSSGRTASPNTAPNFSTHNNDRDNDGDQNNDDAKIIYFGHAAGAADERGSVALTTRYFAAALAADGTVACTLLDPLIAESVAEKNGQWAATSGKTCAIVLSKVLALHHSELVKKQAGLRVDAVRVEGNRGLLILGFPSIPETRQMTEHRVRGVWKLMQPLDSIIE